MLKRWFQNSAKRPAMTSKREGTAMKIKLDHCVIHVSDWERSNTFYHDVLGAEVVPTGAVWAYRFGEAQFNVHGPGLTPTPVARFPVPPGGSDLCVEWAGPIEDAGQRT